MSSLLRLDSQRSDEDERRSRSDLMGDVVTKLEDFMIVDEG